MNRQCSKCGSVVVDGLNFCPSCGAPMETPTEMPMPAQGVNPTMAETPVMPEPTVNVMPTIEPVVPAVEIPAVPVEPVAPVIPEVPVVPTEPVAPVMPEPTVNVQQDVMGIPAVGPVPMVNPNAAPGTGVTVDSLLSTNAEVEAKKEAANENTATNNDIPYTPGVGNIASRSIVSAIVFTVLTCGIYGIYWFIKLTEDANAVSGETKPSGGVAFLLSIVTCGIYTFIWLYKQGEKIAKGGANKNVPIDNKGVLYIALTVFGLSIVSYCLMQSDLNKLAKAN